MGRHSRSSSSDSEYRRLGSRSKGRDSKRRRRRSSSSSSDGSHSRSKKPSSSSKYSKSKSYYDKYKSRDRERDRDRHRSNRDDSHKRSRERRGGDKQRSRSSSSTSSSSSSTSGSKGKSSSSDSRNSIRAEREKMLNNPSISSAQLQLKIEEKLDISYQMNRANAIEEIEAEGFTQRTFQTANAKPEEIPLPLELKPINLPSLDKEILCHPSLILNQREREANWIKKLFNLRQKLASSTASQTFPSYASIHKN